MQSLILATEIKTQLADYYLHGENGTQYDRIAKEILPNIEKELKNKTLLELLEKELGVYNDVTAPLYLSLATIRKVKRHKPTLEDTLALI